MWGRSRRNAYFSSISATSAPTYTETDCIKDRVRIDPACGSGNFLTETYISLRRLENEAIALCQQGKAESKGIKVVKREINAERHVKILKKVNYKGVAIMDNLYQKLCLLCNEKKLIEIYNRNDDFNKFNLGVLISVNQTEYIYIYIHR